MFTAADIARAGPVDAPVIAEMVGELLREIMASMGETLFRFDRIATESRAQGWLTNQSYAAFLARYPGEPRPVGLLTVYESYGLYADGTFGTIPEFYVRAAYRAQGIGSSLVAEAKRYAVARGWTRLEATTPPLPEFEGTMRFYTRQGFQVSGGRKLKLDLS